MSEHRDKAVEAAVRNAEAQIGDDLDSTAGRLALRRNVTEVLQAAEPHLERMYFERFEEAVLSEEASEAAARWPHEQEVPGVWLDDDSWEFEDGHDPRDHIRADAKASLEAALSKAQQLMEEGG